MHIHLTLDQIIFLHSLLQKTWLSVGIAISILGTWAINSPDYVARDPSGKGALTFWLVFANVGSAITEVQGDAMLVTKAQGKNQRTAATCQVSAITHVAF
jgi:hypothetical protein